MSAVTQANSDYEVALKIARHHWPEETENAVIQAAAATVLIHLKELRKSQELGRRFDLLQPSSAAPQAGQTSARTARPGPAPAVPPCPACGGDAWDNRQTKKTSTSPDFRCKNKLCKDAQGRVTAWWVAKQAAQRKAPTTQGYDDMPEALQDDDDDLPF